MGSCGCGAAGSEKREAPSSVHRCCTAPFSGHSARWHSVLVLLFFFFSCFFFHGCLCTWDKRDIFETKNLCLLLSVPLWRSHCHQDLKKFTWYSPLLYSHISLVAEQFSCKNLSTETRLICIQKWFLTAVGSTYKPLVTWQIQIALLVSQEAISWV